jgi:8-oxo-dGTP diphosphatase
MALVPAETLPEERPAAREASWQPVDDLPPLALDHARIVADGLWRLQARVADKAWFVRVGGGLLAPEFTMSEAQRLYEALHRERVDAANFRRDVKATGLLEQTGETRSDGPGRPGNVYRRREPDAGEVAIRERG